MKIIIRPLVLIDGQTYGVTKVIRKSKSYQGNVIVLTPAKRKLSWLPFLVEFLPKKKKVYFKPFASLYLKRTYEFLSKMCDGRTVDLWYPCTVEFLKIKRLANFPPAVPYNSDLHHKLNEILTD